MEVEDPAPSQDALERETVDGDAPALGSNPSIPPAPPASLDLSYMPSGTIVDDEQAGSGTVGGLGTGSKLGRYELRRRLGAGAMGVVFEAHDPDLDRRLAVKVLRVRGGDERRRAVARARLFREAQSLAKLDHPNVISVHDVGRHLGSVYVVMEYVDGRTLQAWLEDTKPSQAQILGVFSAAGRGLAAAHRAGIVHRDFKPENVMVDLEGRVKVLDFGLARARDDDSLSESLEVDRELSSPPSDPDARPSTGDPTLDKDPTDSLAFGPSDLGSEHSDRLTRDGAMLGTPAYMSPEQHLGERVDAATDQFSFCVALYEALYGEAPFAGKTLATRSVQVLQGKIKDPPKDQAVPRWIREILVRGLSVDASARYPSMDELLSALEQDPAVARRRRLRWAGAGAATTAVALGLGLALARPADQCEHTGTLPGWDEAHRTELVDALEAIEVPYAEQTANNVQVLLDDYATDWTGMRKDACLATHVRHEQSSELLDLRVACLDARAHAFGELVRQLESADAESAALAVTATLHLPALDDCADAGRLLDRQSRDASPEARETRLALEADLDAARVSQELAHYDEALEAVERILQEAGDGGDPGLVANTSFLKGVVLEAKGKPAESERALLDAAMQAERAADQMQLGRIRSMLVTVIGDRLARPNEGRIWADFARTSFQLADASEREFAVLDHRLGFVAAQDRKLEEQADLQTSALERYAALPDPDPIVLANMHKDVAGVLGDLARHDEALVHAEKAESMWREHLGDDHPKTIIAVGTRGLLADMRGDYEQARKLLEISEAKLVAALGSDHPQVATMTENLAITLANLGELEASEAKFRRVVEIESALYGPQHPSVVSSLSNLATILRMQGEADEALAISEQILQAVMSDPKAPDGSLKNAYSDLARSYFDLARYDEALEPYREVLRFEEQFYGVGRPGTNIALGNLVECLLMTKRNDEAWQYAERLAELDDKYDLKPDEEAYAKIMVARALLARRQSGDINRARELLNVAHGQLGELPAELERRMISETMQAEGWPLPEPVKTQ